MDEREFELVNIIGADLGANQRDIARLMSLSLGMVNMLLRRLITKGFIRIEQLEKRRVQYILTPKGIAEKLRQATQYTLKTINSLDLIKDKIREILVELYQQGEKHFVVLGRSDFAFLIEIVFKDMNIKDCKINFIDELPDHADDFVLVICKENVALDENKFPKSIDLIHELATDPNLIYPKLTLAENK